MKVIEITDSNSLDSFNAEFPKQEYALVAFLADWCGHCREFKPKWNKIMEKMKRNTKEGMLATVPEPFMERTIGKFQVSGFPTLRLFKKGELVEDYAGKRDAPDLERYILQSFGQKGGKRGRKRKTRRRREKRRGRRRARKRTRRRCTRRRRRAH